MDLYFDNAASCRPFEWAADLFLKTSLEHYANQEASGRLGIRAKKLVDEASSRLASALAPGASVCWCGTGTDALRMAIQAHCSSHPGTEIITTAAEHPALGQAILKFAAMYGITVRDHGPAGEAFPLRRTQRGVAPRTPFAENIHGRDPSYPFRNRIHTESREDPDHSGYCSA